MAPNPYQVGSRTCGCPDCIEDFPPEQYGKRPVRDGCLGPWRARWRGSNGRQHLKTLSTLREARQFLAAVQPKGVHHGA
jgi:hypothetical protein